MFTVFQDYRDARRVLVQGSASLKLQNNKQTINMVSRSAEVPVVSASYRLQCCINNNLMIFLVSQPHQY